MRESRKRKAVSYAESTSGDGNGSDEDAASSVAEEMNSGDSESDDSMDADESSEDDLDPEEDGDNDVVGSDDDDRVKQKGKVKQAPKGTANKSKSTPKAASRPKPSPARAKSAPTSSTSKKSPVNSSRTTTAGGVTNNQGSSSASAIGSVSVTTSVTNASSTGVDITQGPPVTTDAGAKKLVTQYMRQQNRPYSAQQMFDNLHKRIPKATLERVLGVLSGPGEGLLCKEYGKAKIYYVDQSFLPAERSAEQLQDLQHSVLELQDELKVQLQEEKDKRQLLQARRAEPDDNELDRFASCAYAVVVRFAFDHLSCNESLDWYRSWKNGFAESAKRLMHFRLAKCPVLNSPPRKGQNSLDR